jgi:fimbrial chaperone protein
MRLVLAIFALICFSQTAQSGNLSLSPTTLSVAAPSSASAITLTNLGKTTLKMQARVFAWSQRDQGEVFEKTSGVAVSPPFVEIKPGASAVVRVVRTSKRPLITEESYRLFLDEISKASVNAGANVQIVMRHSIPVFFSGGDASAPKLSLAARHNNGRLNLMISNHGGGHLKLWDMNVSARGGKPVSFGEGLNGYVLAGGKNWFAGNRVPKSSEILISAKSNYGPVSWVARVD